MKGQTEFEAMTVGSVMTKMPECLTYDMTIGEATRRLVERRIHGAPVVGRDGGVLGVLSATDVLETVSDKLFNDDCEALERIREVRMTGIGPIITAGAVTCSRFTPLGEACRLLAGERIHRLIVVSSVGDPVGVLSSSDVVRALAGEE